MEKLKDTKTIIIAVLVLAVAVLLFQNSSNPKVVVDDTATGATSSPDAPLVATEAGDTPAGTSVKPMPLSPAVRPAPSTLTGKMVPEFQLPSGFSNTDPFKMQDVVGKKVILVSFQNYTSKPSLRTAPYLNMWHERYKNKGLLVLTVHSPRFAFDRSKSVVDAVAFSLGTYHPIMLDNQFATGRAWGNTELPTHYLVDINGKVVASYKGEGSYESIEIKIQELLRARSAKLKLPVDSYLPFETPKGVETSDYAKVKSVETFFGTARNTALGNATAHLLGIQDVKPYTTVMLNKLYFAGSWDFTSDYAKAATEGGSFAMRYSAKNVDAVLGSLKTSRVRVTLDGAPLGARAGSDIREDKGQSYLNVTEERLYNIVKGDAYGEHTIEMVAETSGLEAYSLQFN